MADILGKSVAETTEEQHNEAGVINATTTAPKKKRRGVNNETRSTSNLKFTEKDATPAQGLFVGVLAEANVTWVTYGEDVQGTPSFAGKSIPRANLHFTSLHAEANEKRHVFLTLNPVESNVETMVGGSKAWQVDRVFATIKHVLEVLYLKGRPFTVEEEDALTLPFDDTEEDGTYKAVEPDEVLAGYRFLFENFIAMLNGTFGANATGKPCYKDANNQPIRLFMKLLRYTKRGNRGWQPVDGRNGDLAFPSFIGEGILEIVKKADQPAQILHINPITESIRPQQVHEAKAPSVPANIMGGGVVPSTPMAPGMAPSYGDPYSETVGDMPF